MSAGKERARHGKPWEREETLAALNLYLRTPFGQMDSRNQQIIELAKMLKRSPGSVAMRMVNLARRDPSLGGRGLKNASSLDKMVMAELSEDPMKMVLASWKEMRKLADKRAEESDQLALELIEEAGTEYTRETSVRHGQEFFRKVVLASYGEKCCITGLEVRGLLNASHIKPWSKCPEQRLNPHNGLCLNALHDRAFDRGFITITPEGMVKVSTHLRGDDDGAAFLKKYDGREIVKPKRFAPDQGFLEYHNQKVFMDRLRG